MSATNLLDVIAEPTETKTPSPAVNTDIMASNFGADFDIEAIEEERQIENEAQEAATPIVPLQPYDAKKHATALVNGLFVVESLALTPIATIKARNSVGGTKAIKAMRNAYQKQFKGEDLDEQEKRLIENLKEFEAKMKLLSDEILPTDREKQNLINAAIPYMEEVRWEIGPGLGFWGMYASSTISKIATIFMK